MNKSISWGVVVLLFPVIAASKPGDAGCVVAEFRTLALTVHNPTERLAAATQWLRTNGDACSGKDIAFLRSASGAWLGTADSPAIQQVFDLYYNAKVKPEDVPPIVPPVPTPAAAAIPAPAPVKPKPVPPVAPAMPDKAAATPAKAAAATATNDMATAALASAMATAAASKAASSLSKMK
jgi:type IV secretory pathway VirB10-like protein